MINYYTEDCAFRFRGKVKTSSWIKHVAACEGQHVGSISVVFCSDSFLLESNNTYLGHNYFTDIITFDDSDRAGKVIHGDLLISIDTVRDNALSFGVEFAEELKRVIIHGILHLCGYKDKTESEEANIHRLEDKYLALYAEEFATKTATISRTENQLQTKQGGEER